MPTQLQAQRAFAATLSKPVESWQGTTIKPGTDVCLVWSRSYLAGEPGSKAPLVLQHDYNVWGYDDRGRLVEAPEVPQASLESIIFLDCEKSPK